MLNIEYLGEKCQHGIGYTRVLPYKQGGSLENAPFIVITALRECAVSCLHKFIFRKNTSFQKEAILISQFFHHNVKSARCLGQTTRLSPELQRNPIRTLSTVNVIAGQIRNQNIAADEA